MFLQFSPGQRNVTEKTEQKIDDKEVNILSLAPFSPNPKIFFENILIGKEAVQKLLIKNPTNRPIHLEAFDNFPEEINVKLGWNQNVIDANGEVILEILWTPLCAGSWRHSLHLEGGYRLKKDIPIAFKSQPKKTSTQSKKKNSVPTFTTKKKRSPVKRISPRRPVLPKICVEDINSYISEQGKENFDRNIQLPTTKSPLNCIDRRSTYCVKTTNLINANPDPKFDDSLEMTSPINSPVHPKPLSPMQRLQLSAFMFSPISSTPQTITNDVNIIARNCSRENSQNLSSETYVKGNISGETYVKGNISSETYVKDSSLPNYQLSPLISNRSRENCDSFAARLDSLTGNNVKNIIEANLWTTHKTPALISIKEESMISENPKNISLKRKSNSTFNFSPNKRANLDVPKGINTWSLKGGLPFRFARKSTGLSFNKDTKTLTSCDTHTVMIQNPFLLAATSKLDPFLTFSVYCTEEWVQEQEKSFKKWLNALLTPPSEMNSHEQNIDVAKLWKQCKKMDVPTAPSREIVSKQYHTSSRLNSLRKLAANLFRSPEISRVLSNVVGAIEKNKLSVRQDRDIHLDLSLQSEIMSIILSYNSLWLRIGLETIYNQVIDLNSNSDIVGLSNFLYDRFFRDPFLIRKHKSIHSPKYNVEVKKFILKKFLTLVYFLDKAKMSQLIQHDPCLFAKNAPIKESREALLKFARDALLTVGDITKYLKHFGYIVEHKQTYINEFNYAVTCLGVDLRDGVRLTKVMEIILLKKDLTKALRVPAISRLQKVHNVTLVFDALKEAGYVIENDICPKDIVNGHKEKTLSFLWQIIYKFQAPLMVKHATIIQKWWRSANVMEKRMILRQQRLRKEEAATKIQKWYRRLVLVSQLEDFIHFGKLYIEELRRNRAAIKIQSFTRMFLARKKYKQMHSAIVGIQTYARKKLYNLQYYKRMKAATKIQTFYRMYRERTRFLDLKHATITIQRRFKANQLMKSDRAYFEVLKYTTIFIQTKFRAILTGKRVRNEYLVLKWATIFTQRRFRANQLCKLHSNYYISLKYTTIIIQQWYRATKAMRADRNYYEALRWAAIKIQRVYKAKLCMRKQRSEFLTLKRNAVKIQQRFRANKLSKIENEKYKLIRKSVVLIQNWYRNIKIMQKTRKEYIQLKQAVLFTQSYFRATKLAQIQKREYLLLKQMTIIVQRRFRANKQCKIQSANYRELKEKVVKIQRWFRATTLMKKEHKKFLSLKKYAIVVQRKFRANKSMQIQRDEFLLLKQTTIIVQRRYRANKQCKIQSSNYRELKEKVLKIQNWFRGITSMIKHRANYLLLKKYTIIVQRRLRANKLMQIQRKEFQLLKQTTIIVQRRFRANKQCKSQSANYKELKEKVVKIQRWFRATTLMKKEHKEFLSLKKYAIVVQKRFRANKLMKTESESYQKLKNATVSMQRRFRANKLAKTTQLNYLRQKWAAITLQRRFLANRLQKLSSNQYKLLKENTIKIQIWYRSILIMRAMRNKYLTMKSATISIQRRFRANLLMKKQRMYYIQLKTITILMQNRFRANKLAKKDRLSYLRLRWASITFQRQFRANQLKKVHQNQYKILKENTVKIQQWFQATKLMKIKRNEYLLLRSNVILIQRRYRQNKLGEKQRKEYLKLREAAITVQKYFRSNLLTRQLRQDYVQLKQTTIFIQARFRQNQLAKKERAQYQLMQRSVVKIQQKLRATFIMRKQRSDFVNLRKAAIVIQRRFRTNILMKKQRNAYLMKICELRLQRNRAAIIIQKNIRGFLVRKKYGQLLTPEAIEERRIKRIQRQAAVKIQSLWRGYKSRSLEKPEVKVIRERANKATAKAKPQMTLGFRCNRALELLINEDEAASVYDILRSLEDIEYITRRCKTTCEKLGKLLPSGLYINIASTSRSLPEMNTCIAAVQILLNFLRYEPTREYTWHPEFIEQILTLMVYWSDKESALFPSICTLLWLFAHNKEYRDVIVASKNFQLKMTKIETACLRKQKMVGKSVNGCPANSFFGPVKGLPLPSRKPDWGLDNPKKPRIFKNSMQAFHCLIQKLST